MLKELFPIFNVKSDLDFEGGEGYFGAKLRTTKTPLDVPVSGLASLPTSLPKASNFSIPKLKRIGTVEVGQGAFGGPFDQGDYVNIDDLPDSAFKLDD